MATVGHSLVGLSLGCAARAHKAPKAFRCLWPGLAVLLAYLPDLVDWIIITLNPTIADRRSVSHSVLVCGGFALAAWLVFFWPGRVRAAGVYIVVPLLVFSHLLLDEDWVRDLVGLLYYGEAAAEEGLGRVAAFDAELWCYGFLLVIAALARAIAEPKAPQPARKLTWVFVVGCLAAVLTRRVWFWGPMYVLAGLHAALVLRRHLRAGLLWSIVPLLPLAGLGVTSVWAANLFRQGLAYEQTGDFLAAEAAYAKALTIPGRESRQKLYMRQGFCRQQTGDLHGAESAYLKAKAFSFRGDWPAYALARLYIENHGLEGFRREEGIRLLEEILRSHPVPELREKARRVLDQVRGER